MITKDILFGWMCAQIGKPYIWGGNGPEHYDCSGLVQDFYRILGIDPPGDQTAQGYYDYWFPKIDVTAYHLPKARVQFGDMLFFGRTPKSISHIAVACNRYIMFEAGGGGRDCTTAEKARKIKAEVRFNAIRLRSDFRLAIRPYHFCDIVLKGE